MSQLKMRSKILKKIDIMNSKLMNKESVNLYKKNLG